MFSTHEYDPSVKYVPASSGWYVHSIAAFPEGPEVGNPETWNRYFIKVEPVAMWVENKENHLEPYIADNVNPLAPLTSAVSHYQNYTFLGVYHHDSYRAGDIPVSSFEYNPLDYLDSEYTKDGVLGEDLTDYFKEAIKRDKSLKEESSEEKKKELFAERMKLEEEKAKIDEELRLATLILDFNESGGAVAL